VTAAPTQVQEGNDSTFTISTSTAPSQPVTVRYSMSGTATLGSDYTLTGSPGQVVIPANQKSATVMLHSVHDNVKESNETATMTLQAGQGYKVGNPSAATVTIINVP
jgi:hypothetical protein